MIIIDIMMEEVYKQNRLNNVQLDKQIYFRKIDSVDNNKNSKQIRTHNMEFTSQILKPLHNQSGLYNNLYRHVAT